MSSEMVSVGSNESGVGIGSLGSSCVWAVSYTHLRAHETEAASV